MPLTGCKLVHVQTVVEIVLVTNFKHAYAVANMTKNVQLNLTEIHMKNWYNFKLLVSSE